MASYSEILQTLKSDGTFRRIPQDRFGEDYKLNLSSNDYLGLGASHDVYFERFAKDYPDVSFTSSASRLLGHDQKMHRKLESRLENLYGKPALLFNSGYHANTGAVTALATPSTLFVCDKLVHASIIDGLKIAGASYKRFPHNDITKLRRILEMDSADFNNVIVVVEAIYSMDGDETPLNEIIKLKKEWANLMVYLDEAHSFGVRGKYGLGLASELGVTDNIDLLIGTFGKAAASMGAFAIASQDIIDLLINRARSFIFSTALPPANVAWTDMMLDIILERNDLREQLKETSEYFRNRLLEITGQSNPSTSQIIPLMVGDAQKAVAISEKLKEAGYIALPIRRPTVPPGGERIRFSLHADIMPKDLDKVFDVIKSLGISQSQYSEFSEITK